MFVTHYRTDCVYVCLSLTTEPCDDEDGEKQDHSLLGLRVGLNQHCLSGTIAHIREEIWQEIRTDIQWNLSNTDTFGPIKCVLIREVSLIQGCPLRGVPLYNAAEI